MNISQIRQEATDRLQEDGNNFPKLLLIHTAIAAGASVVLMLIIWICQYIAPEGGLSNMGTQTLLSTGQTMLQLASMIAVPFWNAGLIHCAVRLLRKQGNSISTLTEGFQRWKAIGASLLIQGLIYFFIFMASSLVSSVFLSTLPLPASLIDDLTVFVESPSLPLSSNVRNFLVVYAIIYLASLSVLLLPRLYSLRLVSYRIMDDQNSCGGLAAVLHSRILMKGNRRKLLMLDLSFWWFYLFELGISLLSMGDLLLLDLGVSIPINEEICSWGFPIAALALRTVLYYYAKPKLAVSYAVFYQKVFEKSLEEPEPPQPKRMPWKY